MSDSESKKDGRPGYVCGDLVHVRGIDPEADRRWDDSIERDEAERERLSLELERQRAKELGVLDEFEKYASEGRYRDFTPRLNILDERQRHKYELKYDRRAYFIMGLIVGAVLWAFAQESC